MKKILFVLGGLDFGGIEVSLLGICKYLKKRKNFYPVVLNISGHGDIAMLSLELAECLASTEIFCKRKISRYVKVQ
jgi:hypothetical protein